MNPIIFVIVLAVIIVLLIGVSIILNMDISIFRKKEDDRNIVIGMAQCIGTREKQDDSFDAEKNQNGTFAIVADGIGGFMDGDMASRIAVDTFMDSFRNTNVLKNINYFFNSSAMDANSKIRKKFGDTPCGTTVVAVLIDKYKLYYTSIGDSIIAVFRNGQLIPINVKQNVEKWLEEQYISGRITREQALNNKKNRRLMNYVGHDGFKSPETSDNSVELKQGDKILLYSDGVELLTQIEMEEILSMKLNVQEKAEEIIKKIMKKRAKNKDNSTVIILDVQ